jgi:WD40 repeat protein
MVRIWTLSERLFPLVLGPYRKSVESVEFSPDNLLLAVACGERKGGPGTESLPPCGESRVKIYDTHSGELLKELFGHQLEVERVTFSPQGSLLATVAGSNDIKIWDVHTWKELRLLRPDDRTVRCICFSPDGQRLTVGTLEGDVLSYVAGSGQIAWSVDSAHESTVNSMAFSADGTKLATGSWDGYAKIWDAFSGNLLAKIECGLDVTSVAFSPDGSFLATAESLYTLQLPVLESARARIWDLNSHRALKCLRRSCRSLRVVAFSPDGAVLATGDETGAVAIWTVPRP